MSHPHLRLLGAREHTLRSVDVEIPRRALTVVTGVSGSGKTSLVFDTIAAEARRQLNETFPAFVRNRLPSQGRPDVDVVENLSPAVVVDQRRLGHNARSTVGTISDVAPLLRLLFSRAGTPVLRESTAFSFNDAAGMCPRCRGLGEVTEPAPETFLDLDRTLEQGAIRLPGFGTNPEQARYWYRKYTETGLFRVDVPLRAWTARERDLLVHGGDALPVESLVAHVERLYARAEGEISGRKRSAIERFTTTVTCPDCGGARLNATAREVRVAGRTITECCADELDDLLVFVEGVDGPAPVLEALVDRLRALVDVGLGYLTMDRPTGTLSGGEAQRVKTVRHLASSLTEMLVIFDEPSVGLHPCDVERLVGLLRALRDRGNTVLVVEHAREIVAIADHVVDLGPGPGAEGGRIVFSGPPSALAGVDSPTGRAMTQRTDVRTEVRASTGALRIRDARRHTLRGIDVDVPTGVLTAITGVAGSGKSSLVDVLVEQHPGAVRLDQSGIATGRRSSVATWTGIAEVIRRRFARAHGVRPASFSANSTGACRECDGLGQLYTDLAFLEGVAATCPSCAGRRFTDEVLAMTVDGRSIADVLDLGADAARPLFTDEPTVAPILDALADVGLGHLALGRALSTLSGGECQRLALAVELARHPSSGLYVLDEPTTGLHPRDVAALVDLLDRLVDDGHTVVVVEHDLDVVRRADHVIDLGPGAGRHGGQLLFTGPPAELTRCAGSATGAALRSAARGDPTPTSAATPKSFAGDGGRAYVGAYTGEEVVQR